MKFDYALRKVSDIYKNVECAHNTPAVRGAIEQAFRILKSYNEVKNRSHM